MVKIQFGRHDDAFLEILFFLTASKPSRRSITAAKKETKEEKGKGKSIPKIEKFKEVGQLLLQNLKTLISAHAWGKML